MERVCERERPTPWACHVRTSAPIGDAVEPLNPKLPIGY